MSSPVTLYAHAAPAHEHALFAAPRPLPGRQVGRVAGMVFDVDPAYEEEAVVSTGNRSP